MLGETQEEYQERNRAKLADWRHAIIDMSGHVQINPALTLATTLARPPSSSRSLPLHPAPASKLDMEAEAMLEQDE